MKTLLLLILMLLPLSAFAQAREETEQWILEKASVSMDLGLNYKIKDENLISELLGVGMGVMVERTIPIASVTMISHVRTDKYLTFFLSCDEDCAYFVQTDSDGKFKKDGMQGKFLLEMYGNINPEIVPRMQKALLHLVELHGGKAKLVAYQKPKEAF